MYHTACLHSKLCAYCFTEMRGQEHSFGLNMKYFNTGTLYNSNNTRTKYRKYIYVEEKLTNHVKICVY